MAAPKLAPRQTQTLVLSNRDMLFEQLLAAARSCLPSPLKSPTAIDSGCVPTSRLVAGWKLPSPLPSSTDRLLELSFVVTRSCLLSPLKSATATERGFAPVPKLEIGRKSCRSVPNKQD